MKKFTIKGALDGFRSKVAQPARPDQDIQETLRPEHFQIKRTFRHGFPSQPTAMAFDPIQRLLAIGTKCGSLRILGRPGVDVNVRHDLDGVALGPGGGGAAVLQIQFLVNEGALITATADDTLHLWSFRQKVPQIVQKLKFQREKITCMHLPLQSKWLYLGTDKGNIHVVHIESFVLSGYVINWNKAIEVCRKTHPGSVVHLSDNPLDASKLLIGFETGQVALWDLRSKVAEFRCQTQEPLRSIAWHHEGKQFMCSHTDGTLTTWQFRQPIKPINVSQPHAKLNKDNKPESCKPINKVDWKSSRDGEAYVIFSGGTTYDTAGRTPSITVIHSKTTTVLEMEHNVVDFITLCESPWSSELQEPYAIVVLLQNDLVVMDLQTAGFPCLENPYPMDVHESPVTCCSYFADCPGDLVPAFYSVGRSSSTKRTSFSEREWPINGGEWSAQSCSYSEIIVTGHADGSVKFWDAGAGTLQILYKLKTSKVFERPRTRSIDGADDDPFAIEVISLCPESRKLCIAGASSHVILFKFRKAESTSEIAVLEIPIVYENTEDVECSPDYEYPRSGSASRLDTMEGSESKKENQPHLKVRPGPQKKLPGFQAQMVCLTPWSNGEAPGYITSLAINSSYGLMAYGNEAGIVVVDIVQKICLLNIGSPDLYGAQDPYSRAPRSPKRGGAGLSTGDGFTSTTDPAHARSPSIDQINGECCPSQTVGGSTSSGASGGGGSALGPGGSINRGRPDPPRRSRSQDKLDSSFSRSRSSSMSSLENISSEAIQCLAFADSYTKKSEPTTLCPTLWIGTSLGSVITMPLTLPDKEVRSSQPVVVSLVGITIFRLKGSILNLSFLDCNGALIPYSYEAWRDENKEKKDRTPTKSSNRMSPTLGEATNQRESFGDRQFVVIASEKQARVVALPSQTCIYRQQLVDSDFVVKAETISLRDSVCLMCYASNGHLSAYSLPSLRPLIEVDFLPLTELRITRTFCFSNRGHGLYLTSPSELQKFTLCTDFCGTLTEMMGELFLVLEMPEPPKESFFKGLFGGGIRSLDREELFGESSGKASKAVAKHIPGSMGDMGNRVTSATSEVGRAHMMMVERGTKLNQLEERTERMMNESENFASSAHSLMLKYKDKKWYQL